MAAEITVVRVSTDVTNVQLVTEVTVVQAAPATVNISGGGGGATALDDLTDVTITAAATGDLIRYNGSAWVDYPDSNYAAASALASYLTTAAAASTYQPLDSDLTAIAALSTTSFGRSLLALADAAALRSTAGTDDAANLTTGTVATARLGSGTANSSSYLRGDQTWATISAGSADPQSGALFFGIQCYGGF